MRLIALANKFEETVDFLPHTMITAWGDEQSSAERGWEWYYLYGSTHLKPLHYAAGAEVSSLDFSPDGKWVAYSASNPTVIRDLATSVIRRILEDEDDDGHEMK